MKEGELIVSGTFSDLMGISSGNRLFLKKKYSNQLKSVEEWIEICKKDDIEIKGEIKY